MKRILLMTLMFGAVASVAIAAGTVIDTCDTVDSWTVDQGEGATIKLESVKGKVGKAVKISYDLGAGRNWVQISREALIKVTPKNAFRFWVQWTGNKNAIEFKVVDKDGSVFGRKFDGLDQTRDWQSIVIPVGSLKYWWGGDNELNMDGIVEIAIAVSEKESGAGTVEIDEVRVE